MEKGLSPLIIKYERTLENDPRSRVFAPLAEAYRKVGLLENAFQVLKKGLRYNPEYLMGYLCLAQCYLDKGEAQLSYATLKPLVPQNRENLRLQKTFAESAFLIGNKDEALDAYKYLLFLQPRDAEISEKVKELEKELKEDTFTKHSHEIRFKEESLKASPELDQSLDDWLQVDLSGGETKIDSEKDSNFEEDEWTVGDGQKTNEIVTIEEEEKTEEEVPRTFYVKAPVQKAKIEEVKPETKIDSKELEDKSAPVITHTLVDLYIQQGHRDKAITILEKILDIQPNNDETKRRLSELRQLESFSERPKLIEEEQELINSEDEGRSNLMAALDSVSLKEDDNEQDEEDSSIIEDLGDVLNEFLISLQNEAKSHGRHLK